MARYVKPTKVRAALQLMGLRMGRSYVEALDRSVLLLIEKHASTARQDRRVTVLGRDIELTNTLRALSRAAHSRRRGI